MALFSSSLLLRSFSKNPNSIFQKRKLNPISLDLKNITKNKLIQLGMEKTKPPFQNPDWTFLNRTTQLPIGISHLYELRIAQTWRRWKDNSMIFLIYLEAHLTHHDVGVMVI